MSLYFDPRDRELNSKMQALQPTPGYCIVVDIVGSTAVKDSSVQDWAVFIHNAFQYTLSFLSSSFVPLKSIGDCLMFFISQDRMLANHETALHFFSGLCRVAAAEDPLFSDVKISAVFCQHAYEITFIPGTEDVYGKDIDLTMRLLAKAGSREILMNEGFVQQVRGDYAVAANPDQYREVQRIVGPWPEAMKGFVDPVLIYKLPRLLPGTG
ncbi:MAG: hypothetical protein KGS61_12395 [Verrucomicrobia bacterium]|nr:hypothetical protein [Verrucomicrobiota bacterium]